MNKMKRIELHEQKEGENRKSQYSSLFVLSVLLFLYSLLEWQYSNLNRVILIGRSKNIK